MKGNLRRLLAIFLVLVLLSADICAIAEAVATLTLPKALKIIEEEAFAGNTSIEKVIVPDGTTEIRSRAFADSSMTELVLPDSLEFIAEDAFEGCGEFALTVPENCYAYDRCVELGLIKPDEPDPSVIESAHPYPDDFDYTWTYDAGEGTESVTITFSADTETEEGYDFIYLYTLDDVQVGEYSGKELAGQSVTIDGTGFKLRLVSDEAWGVNECYGFKLDSIVPKKAVPLNFDSITAESSAVSAGEIIRWTVATTGGKAPVYYDYTVLLGEEEVATGTVEAPNAIEYTPVRAGEYKLSVIARDSAAAVLPAQLSDAVIVAPSTAYPESAHPYAANTDQSWVYAAEENVESLKITFSEETKTQSNYDYIYIYDQTGAQFGKYSGTQLAGQTIEIMGSAFTIRLTSNGNTHYHGFTITNIEKYIPGPLSFVSLTVDKSKAKSGELITWTMETEGGRRPVTYEYTVTLNGETKYTGSVTRPEQITYVPMTAGDYTMSVVAKDAEGNELPAQTSKVRITERGETAAEYFTIAQTSGNFAKITAYTGTDTAVVIPSVINGYTIESIDDRAFQDNTVIISVALPGSLKEINYRAFRGCTNLRSVYIPDSVTYIGEEAFYNCSKLADINYPLGWTSASSYGNVFKGTALKTIVIPEGVTSIPAYAFRYCTNFAYFDLPSTIETIGGYAFAGCTGLTSLDIPEKVKVLNSGLLKDCTGLVSVSIPAQATTLEDRVFEGCTHLASVTLPETLERIDYRTFCSCTSLTSMYIPDSVTYIGEEAFYNCSKLADINYPLGWTSASSYGNVFTGTALKTMVIPEGVTFIPNHAFKYCSNFTSITLPSTLQVIGDHSFRECTGLSNMHMPEKLITIGDSAFYGCTGLTNVYLNEGLEYLDEDVFMNCTGLTEIYLPDSIHTIMCGAFKGCTNLASMNYPMGWKTTNGYADIFTNTALKTLIIPEGVTSIPQYAFRYCTNFTHFELPDSLQSIPAYAFAGCTNLEKIWIPEGIEPEYDEEGNQTSFIPIASTAFNDVSTGTLTIHGVSGSYAETFADSKGYPFVAEAFEYTPATLSGTVTDAAGNPLSGVTVTVYKGPTTNYPFGSTTTNSSGAWTMENVKVGSYYGVGFEKEGYAFTPSQLNLTAQDGVNTLGTVIGTTEEILTYISTSQSDWYIDVNAAMSDVEVNASGNWYISETPDWLHLYVMDGVTAASAMESDAMPAATFAARISRSTSSITEYASGSHMLMCAEYNNSGADRDGIVALNIGNFVKKIFVKQAADTAVPTIEILRPSTNGSTSIVAETVTTIEVAASNFKTGYITIYDASGNAIHEESFKQTEYSTKYTFPQGEFTIIAGVSDDSKAESGDVSMITASCTVSSILSTDSGEGRTTDKMIEYIKKREGFVSKAEPDSAFGGDYTIGYGHKICSPDEWNAVNSAYRATWENVVWDVETATAYLKKDIKERFEPKVIELEGDLSKELGYTFKFTDQQFDAIVSMYYNGVGEATNSGNRLGKCLRNLSGSEDWQIRNGFITWHHDTYKIKGESVFCDVSGLYYRRLEESNIFLYGDYTVRYDWPHPSWLNIIEGEGYGPNGGEVPDYDWYSGLTESISVTPSKLSYTVNGGSSRFQVESGSNWTLTVPEEAKTWLTVDKYSGSNGDSVKVTAAANAGEVRTATITVKCNNSTRRVEVEQAGRQSTQLRASVEWDALNVDDSGVSTKHTGEVAWAEITATGGAGGYTYQIDVYCNNVLEMQTVRTTANIIGVIPNNSGRYHIVVNVRDAEGKVVSVKTPEVQVDKVNLRITEPSENGQVLYMSNLPMVRWTGIADADHYAVYLKKHGATNHIINGEEVYNCYLDVSEYEEYIEENAAYNVWIEARNSNNVKIGDGALYVFSVGPLSAITITEPATTEVPRPNGDYLHVEWDDVPKATYYQITMRDLSTGDLLQGKEYYKVESSSADFACSVLSEGHEYRVWIAAFDDGNGRIAESGMTFVYVPNAAIQVDLTSKIAELKNKLPAGSYWAHTPDTSYNEFTTNTSGCSCEYKHGESRRGVGGHQSSNGPGTDGSCGCNSYRGAIQCNGYARVICDYLFGSNWANESSKWKNVGTDIAVAKVGDVICTTYDHYMVVSSVNNGVVKVTDCNYLTNCLIRWDASTSYFVEHDQIKWIKRCSDVEETQTPPTTEVSFTYTTGVTPLSATRETALRSVMEKRAGSTNGYATQIYLIEGFGDDLSADGRGSAMCVVVKNGTIVYTNTSCATLPDQPFHAQSNPTLSNKNNKADWDDQPNVIDGVYSVANVTHSNYPALQVVSAKVYRIHSKSCGGGTNGEIHSSKCGTTTSGGIHIHKKSSENCEIFTTDANGNNTGWVNSSGCAIIPTSAWDSFASAVGFTGGATISNTCVVYDRRYAYENVPGFKAYMQEKYTDTEGYAFDAGYYDETAVKKICGIQ